MEEDGLLKMKVLLDANACLRYLLEDIEEQVIFVTECVENGAEITIEVLAECVYVLEGVYNVEKPILCKTLYSFLDEVACERKTIAKSALNFFSENNIDFVDCILLAEKNINNRKIVTFDKKLQRKLKSVG